MELYSDDVECRLHSTTICSQFNTGEIDKQLSLRLTKERMKTDINKKSGKCEHI